VLCSMLHRAVMRFCKSLKPVPYGLLHANFGEFPFYALG
jgi:hypothetical protein